MRLRAMAVVSALVVGSAAPRAEAAFHLMNIVEVFPGTPAAPGAQYVVLQMWADGQNQMAGHVITFYDRFGGSPVNFTFPTPNVVLNGANQAKILIANAAAQSFFNVTPELLITGTPIRAEGGKICFEIWDCVAWGNYVGDPAGVGTPFERPVGLRPGVAVQRRLDVFGSPAILDANDDTHDSANDFRYGTPMPTNNANVTGTIPVAVCQNAVTEGLEQCDDGNAVPDDTCNATCDVTRLFADGFESGDASRWHATSTGSGIPDLTVTGAAAITGGFGLQGVVNDTDGLFVQNDSPLSEGRYRVRFRFDPNGFDPGEAEGHLRTRILIGFQAPQRRVFALVLRRQVGQYAIMGRARRNDNSQANTGFFNITDGPHTIELDWRRSPFGANGSLGLWIDGTLATTLGGIDNDLAVVDFVRLGALSVKTGAAGTLYWDDLDSRRETYVGP